MWPGRRRKNIWPEDSNPERRSSPALLLPCFFRRPELLLKIKKKVLAFGRKVCYYTKAVA